jgi:hypothetical protein
MKVTIHIEGMDQPIEAELPEETDRDLQEIASRNGLSFAAALQQAIANERFLDEQQANGAKLLIEKDDKLRELVREPA